RDRRIRREASPSPTRPLPINKSVVGSGTAAVPDAAFGAKAVTRSTSPSMKFKLPVVYPMAFVSITRTRVVEPGPTALPGPPGVVGANWKPTVPPEAERPTDLGGTGPGPTGARPPKPSPP